MHSQHDPFFSVISPLELFKGEITSGHMLPGEKLNVAELCERYDGLSSTAVRDALFRLQQMGLVSSNPHIGFYVTEVTPAQSLENIFLYCKFEISSIGVIPALSPRESLFLEEPLKQMGAASIRGDTAEAFRRHHDFCSQLHFLHSLETLRSLIAECWNKALLAGLPVPDRQSCEKLFTLDHRLLEALRDTGQDDRRQIAVEIERTVYSIYADYIFEAYAQPADLQELAPRRQELFHLL